jgi:hypothetical protein
MPRAQSADGVIHDFPDGTAPAVIDRVMKEYARTQNATPAASNLNKPAEQSSSSGVSSYLTESLDALKGALPEVGRGARDIAAEVLGGDPRPGMRRLGDVAQFATGGLISPLTPETGLPAIGKAAERIGEAGKARAALGAEKFIGQKYQTAVRPDIGSRGTATAVKDYNERTRSAVDSIVQNKANLSFEGGAETGRLPQSLSEFSEAGGLAMFAFHCSRRSTSYRR